MMKRILPVLGLVMLFLGSCAVSNDVVSDGAIQKRKYRKGYFVDLNKKQKADKFRQSTEEVAFAEQLSPKKAASLTTFSHSTPELKSTEVPVAEHKTQGEPNQSKFADYAELNSVPAGYKPDASVYGLTAVTALTAVDGMSSNSLLRNGLILILIGLILQLIGGFSGLFIWIGGVLVLIGLIMIIIYLINRL